MKVKELRQAYQKTKEAKGCSGSDTCCFYDQLHAILGGAPSTAPPWSMDTCKGGVSCNREEDFVDDDEENAQQANGESVLPSSQDLFITLEPIPSQGRIPNPEAGERTSGEISQCKYSASHNRVTKEIEVFSDWFLNVIILDV
ncbi:hypothetical protein UY3_06421 [Chelonia mydas]|uniref:Uncharacterized protein n=1 Tax=Chelonia mydas TaxID=8469 RepID=M7BGV4_CHEMY|nr:hypothetical protein UY3_06421 [Chelonia mydas]